MRKKSATEQVCRTLLVILFFAPVIWASQDSHDHPAPENLGVVSFPTSCKPEVQREFARGVALLHSFAYSAAEASFRDVTERDATCAIAHWGVAMTYFHELWDPPIRPDTLARGRQEIQRAQQIGKCSDRERRFIHALAVFYDHDLSAISYSQRVLSYQNAMGELAAAYPNDVESQVFDALALLASASPFDKTHTKQKRAVSILSPLFRRYPRHPGIAHYLIHASDNQEMAQQGLAAARAYSKIAPSAPHALHMPSHIFTRLGMWSDSIASNQAARLAAHNQADVGEELHAMDYLVYAFLQQGREPEAKQVIEQLKLMPNLDLGDFKVAYASIAMPVRHAMERRQWQEAAAISPPVGAPPQVTAVAFWARGVGLARSRHPADARQEVEKLRQLEQQLRTSTTEYSDYWAEQVEIQALEVSAWSAQSEGRPDEAQNLLRRAADKEDGVEKLPVTPGPVIPAREQLGDLLLEQNQPALALKEFRVALANAPGRRTAVMGMSQATKALGTSAHHRHL